MSILEFMGPAGYTPAGMDPTEFFVNGDEPYVLASDYTILPQPTSQHLVVPPLPSTIDGAAAAAAAAELLSISPETTVLPESLSSNAAPVASYKPHDSPTSTTSGSASSLRKRGRLPSPPAADDADEEAVIKRQRNTMAARKYRQKRLDRISDLERSLGDMTDQRDALKLQLARKEAEVDALREMLSRK